jgi:hypothetical protein
VNMSETNYLALMMASTSTLVLVAFLVGGDR